MVRETKGVRPRHRHHMEEDEGYGIWEQLTSKVGSRAASPQMESSWACAVRTQAGYFAAAASIRLI